MNFKLIVLVCAVLIFEYTCAAKEKQTIHFTEQDTTKILEAVMACISNTNFKPEIFFNQVKEGKYSEDRSFQELIHCSFKKTDSLLDNGRVDVVKVLAMFPKDVDVTDEVTECGKEVGSDEVETTFKFFKCFQVKVPVAIQFT